MLALTAAGAFIQSSFFTISEITVHGARHLSASELITRSGLYRGQVLSSIHPFAVADRLSALPWVAAARVQVTPTGHVDLLVDERVAVAALPYRSRYVLLDPGGVAIEIQSTPPVVPLISVEGVAVPWLRLGDRVPSRGVREAVQSLALMPPDEIARGLRLHVDRTGAVIVTTTDSVTVLLGQPRGLGARAAVLPQVLAAIRRQHLRSASVDLRYTGSVILRGEPATLVRGVHR
jgi:cell division septal protein FtsQ